MSTYSSDLKLELIATGDASGTWGADTNNNLNLIQQAIAGYEAITLSSGSTLALAMTNKAISTARNMVIKFATASIAASTICTIPDGIEKFYIFDCSGLTNPANLTIKTVSGTGFTLNAAKIFAAYSDGTNLNEISLDTLGGTIAAADITGTISTAQLAANAVTTAKITPANVTSDSLAANAVTTAKITPANVTTASIADDAVTADKLANTAVTAGTYSTANITVDAQGRLTAASAGAGGDGNYYPRKIAMGPASGNLATPSNSTKFYAYVASGGGGGGGAATSRGTHGGAGGAGSYGFFTGNVAASTTYAYNVGGAGSAGAPSAHYGAPGGAGGTTNVGVLFSVTGGNGGNSSGNGNSPGGPGNAGNDGSPDFSLPNYYLVGVSVGSGGNPGTPSSGSGSGGSGTLNFFDDGGSA